jgi:phage gp16-like protein
MANFRLELNMATDRRGMLAKVHVAKKQLGLDDDSYRAVVVRITGRDSAGKASAGDLERLLAEFTRLGFKPAPAISGKSWVRKIHAIWNDLAPLLDGATDATLAAFVARQTKSQRNPEGIAKPEWLDAKEATKVIQGLEGWLARARAAREKAA